MDFSLENRVHHWVGHFQCMASPCEVLIETDDQQRAHELIQIAYDEATRIEHKYSRYRDDNIVFQINSGTQRPIEVDQETKHLFDFAEQCYQLSEGLFDITSGVFRTAWNFKSDRIPSQKQLNKILPFVGWDKIEWKNSVITLPKGMQIDFGGIGKEYAVDKVVALLKQQTTLSFMVNFGGDCHVSGPQLNNHAWITGIENPDKIATATEVLKLSQGALATSGDAYRYIDHKGKRYGHIINPKTGWPALNAPRSVTVAAATCTDAGILSTLAMLQGKDAEQFLQHQGVKFWCFR